MEASAVLSKIKALKIAIFQTRDISVALDISITTASQALRRLEKFGHTIRLQRGLWALPEKVEPLMLPEYLTAPYACYVSLQSALYHHGMIEQIPEVIYAVTLMRTKKFKTQFATVSAHHIPPSFFGGFISVGTNNIKIATPEKALLDFFYLSTAKSRLFTRLPELEIPQNFDVTLCKKWIKAIPTLQRRSLVEKKFLELNLG
ncbi:MAG: hypothetical protein WCW01_01960 [Gammaproteobacteria bacterium]